MIVSQKQTGTRKSSFLQAPLILLANETKLPQKESKVTKYSILYLMRYRKEFLIHSFYVFLWHLRGNFRVFQIVPESCYRAQDECVTNRFVIGREKFKWSLWRSWSSGLTSWIWGRTNHWKMSAQESQVENLKITSLIEIILLQRFHSIIIALNASEERWNLIQTPLSQ